jgi:regulator of RNase E activity RraA
MTVCRIHPPGPDPAPALLARCTRLPTSILSDAMERTGGATGVHWVRGARWERAAGPAFTVRTRAGDNLVVHRALDLTPPGSVLVIDAGGHLDRAVFGEIMARYAAAQGVRAVVVDGAVRDVEGLAAGPVPVFARGVSHLGPYKAGPGEIGGPVQVGGAVVRTGDIVVGDADGVAVVPACRLAEVLDTAEGLLRNEEGVFAAIAAGTWDRGWVRAALDETEVPA